MLKRTVVDAAADDVMDDNFVGRVAGPLVDVIPVGVSFVCAVPCDAFTAIVVFEAEATSDEDTVAVIVVVLNVVGPHSPQNFRQ